jgi:hypothetical protein
MGECNERHTPTFKHLELEAEGLDLSDLDLGDYEGPHQPSSTTVLYTVSLILAKGAENDNLASVLKSFPDLKPGDVPQLYYNPGVGGAGGSCRERAQKRLRADLAQVLRGVVPPNTKRPTAAPV